MATAVARIPPPSRRVTYCPMLKAAVRLHVTYLHFADTYERDNTPAAAFRRTLRSQKAARLNDGIKPSPFPDY